MAATSKRWTAMLRALAVLALACPPALAGGGITVVAGLALAAPARAQDDNPFSDSESDTVAVEGGEGDEEAAETGDEGGDNGSNLPSYTTNYKILRQTKEWGQILEFGQKFNTWDLKSNTDFTIGNDTGSNSETRTGNTRAQVNYRGLRGFPLLLNAKLGRTSVDSPNLQSENQTRSLGLTARVVRKWMGIRHNLALTSSYDNVNSLSASAKSSSQSSDGGVTGGLDWKGTWNARPDLKFDADYKLDRAAKNSRLTQSDVDTVTSKDTSRKANNYGVKVQYDPTAWFTGAAGYTSRASDEELFQLQNGTGALERRQIEDRTLNISFNVKPMKETELTWTMSSNENLQDYRVRQQLASDGNGSDWSGKLKTKLLDTGIEAELSSSRDYTRPRQTLANERVIRVFEGKALRTLSPKFEARVNWEVRLRQQFFEGTPAEVQDKDEQKIKVDTGLNYTPGGRWTAALSYVRENTRSVEVNRIRAGETNRQENHTVTVAIGCKISPRTNITQNYYIQASYTTFDFQSRKNTLNATQRIVTKLTSNVTPRVKLGLTHNFNLIDSGPFVIEAGRGRVFKRSSRAYRQDLTADVEYALTTWFKVTANQRFFRSDNLNEATGERTIARDLQLREGFQAEQQLGGGLSLRANGEYVRSSTTKSYLTLQSSLNKDF